MGFFSKNQFEERIAELRSFNMPNEDKVKELLLCQIKNQEEQDAKYIHALLGIWLRLLDGIVENNQNTKKEKLLKLIKNNMLNGKKTFIVAGLMAVFAIIGLALDLLSAGEAGALFLEAMALSGLRVALINK